MAIPVNMANFHVFLLFSLIAYNFIAGNAILNEDDVNRIDRPAKTDGSVRLRSEYGEEKNFRKDEIESVQNLPLVYQEASWKNLMNDEALEGVICDDEKNEKANGIDDGKLFTQSSLSDTHKNPEERTINQLSLKSPDEFKIKSSCMPRHIRKLLEDYIQPTSDVLKKGKVELTDVDARREFFSRFPVSSVTESVDKYLSRFTHAPLTTPGPRHEAYTSLQHFPPTDPYPHGSKPGSRHTPNNCTGTIYQFVYN